MQYMRFLSSYSSLGSVHNGGDMFSYILCCGSCCSGTANRRFPFHYGREMLQNRRDKYSPSRKKFLCFLPKGHHELKKAWYYDHLFPGCQSILEWHVRISSSLGCPAPSSVHWSRNLALLHAVTSWQKDWSNCFPREQRPVGCDLGMS
jgi:hypothetical protein